MKNVGNLEKIGEMFGSAIVDHVRANRAFTVTILSVDDDYAYVTMTGSNKKMSVPLTNNSIPYAAITVKPNVGSLSIVALANGSDNAPFFMAHSQVDKVSFVRGTTSFSWEITPTGRDADGNEIDGETNDVINLAIGESTLKVDTDIWEFNGGTLGGLVTLENVTDKLNALEKGYNDLVTKYNAHIHETTATVGSSPTPGVIYPTTSVETTVLVETKPTDIENDKITQ